MTSTDIAISAHDLSKKFRLYSERPSSLRERITRRSRTRYEELWALRDVSFEVKRGTTFGVIGHNGSGKSTLMKLVAGVHRATSGTITANGRVAPLLELGAGFHPDLTGRENVYLNGAILGMSKKEITASFDYIVDFSGIGAFIDSPIKIYSSGMYVRLAFSVAVAIDPEILVVDEVIAAGDEEFQRKCLDRLYRLRENGTTIVVVSHALSLLRDICDEGLWLDHGQMKAIGPVRDVVDEYLAQVNRDSEDEGRQSGANSSGSGEIVIHGVEYLDPDLTPSPFVVSGSPVRIRVHYTSSAAVGPVSVALTFTHESGLVVASPSMTARGQTIDVEAGDAYVDYVLDSIDLLPAAFLLSVTMSQRGHVFAHVDRGFELHVRPASGATEAGFLRLGGRWSTA